MRNPFMYVGTNDMSDYLHTDITTAKDYELCTGYMRSATRDIDALTFNRITDFNALTAFQKEIVTEACLRLTAFKMDNAELLESPLKSYSINGVSMSLDDVSIQQINGVYIPSDIYALLQQTGFTCRAI